MGNLYKKIDNNEINYMNIILIMTIIFVGNSALSVPPYFLCS